jgi:hypothetical protein
MQENMARAKFYSFPSFHGFDGLFNLLLFFLFMFLFTILHLLSNYKITDLMEGLEAQREMTEDETANAGGAPSHHNLSRNRVDSPLMVCMLCVLRVLHVLRVARVT